MLVISQDGWTPLLYAAKDCNFDLLKYLHSEGAGVDCMNSVINDYHATIIMTNKYQTHFLT